jgi:flagellar biosynthesis protein FliP
VKCRHNQRSRSRRVLVASFAIVAALVGVTRAPSATDELTVAAKSPPTESTKTDGRTATASFPSRVSEPNHLRQPVDHDTPADAVLPIPFPQRQEMLHTLQTVALFGLISLAPVALLMVTAFVRINIVLILLRQALGSPQIPGNQVLAALALLLTALVMQPVGEKIYHEAIIPYSSGQISAAKAWAVGTKPIKVFMIDQIVWTKHPDYLRALHDYAIPPSPSSVPAGPASAEDFPLRIVAPAYLLSELTTALTIGFVVYLPFLVIDLVVASVLAATGLFMLPPTLVAMPVKLIVFVLADGWMLVATMLLSSFAVSPGGQ